MKSLMLSIIMLSATLSYAQESVHLGSETRIPAKLESEILVSDQGDNRQMVEAKILSDVYDSQNKTVIIPKGSIATAKTYTFDAETGTMQLFFKVKVEAKTFHFKTLAGNGYANIRGYVINPKGEYQLGGFIKEFSASTGLDSFKVAQTYPKIESVKEKIASTFSKQDKGYVFWVPQGMPIILQ